MAAKRLDNPLEDGSKAKRRSRGRPSTGAAPVANREQILDEALNVFADLGYESSSLRELARRLNVSHGLITARFGSKRLLWQESVDHGIQRLIEQLEKGRRTGREMGSPDQRLKDVFVSFLLGLSQAPAVVRMMALEGQRDSERLRYIIDRYLSVGLFEKDLFPDGPQADAVRQVPHTLVFFLVAHGGGAIFALPALAARLGVRIDASQESAAACAEAVADILINGIISRDPIPS